MCVCVYVCTHVYAHVYTGAGVWGNIWRTKVKLGCHSLGAIYLVIVVLKFIYFYKYGCFA